MRVPALLHGLNSEVRRRISAAVRAFAGGRRWDEALGAESLVDVEATQALVVLNGPAPLLSTESHIHAYLPISLVLEAQRKGTLSEPRRQEAIEQALRTPWGLLGILAPANQLVVYPPAMHRAVLGAALEAWDTLDGIGKRYTVGLREGARLWDVTTNLHYVLARLGVDERTLSQPLPAGGLRAIAPGEPG
jgi:hypothetical protein